MVNELGYLRKVLERIPDGRSRSCEHVFQRGSCTYHELDAEVKAVDTDSDCAVKSKETVRPVSVMAITRHTVEPDVRFNDNSTSFEFQ